MGKRSEKRGARAISCDSQGRAWVNASPPHHPSRAGRQGNKSILGSRCLALLGQWKGVTHEAVEAACASLHRTKPVPEAKAPLNH